MFRYFFVVFLFFFSFVFGQATFQDSHSQLSIRSEFNGLVLDQVQWVLFQLDLQEGWHTYGKDSEDGVYPFTLEIEQEGVEVGGIVWQDTIAFDFLGAQSVGYQDQAYFLVPITFSSSQFASVDQIELNIF